MQSLTRQFNRNLRFDCQGARFSSSFVRPKSKLKSDYDAIIVGGGHNGLVASAYLALSGARVCVLERRHVIGGAAVTEEIVPGYKFSRASYLLSLFRPQIMKELELKKYGLKVYLRDPNSYTPMLDPHPLTGEYRSLLLGRNAEENRRQIGKFSVKDAESFSRYEDWLQRIVDAVQPLVDSSPVDLNPKEGIFADAVNNLPNLMALLKSGRDLRLDGFRDFLQLMTSPASKILDQWFESEPLKASLATDAVIGAMITPQMPGSGYVLLHHVMGELEGVKGAWGYVEGGMGAVSEAIARSAADKGAEIFVECPVAEMIVDGEGGGGGGGGRVKGVVLEDGTEIRAKSVLSNATPEVTFNRLIHENYLPKEFLSQVRAIDYASPVTKINVALSRLPNFLADPNDAVNVVQPHHRATIHLNCEESAGIDAAYRDAVVFGTPSRKPVIELVIPSSLDPTLAPVGHHVGLLFTQYTPYHRQDGRRWDDDDGAAKKDYAQTVFQCIEGYAPGFLESIVGYECLTPVDLEREFGLTGGNIFHGSLGLDQLYCQRPVASQTGVKTPLEGLFLCGSGAHPGGGVMGAAGKLGANAAAKYLASAKSQLKRVVTM